MIDVGVCDICEGTELLYQEIQHSEYCDEIQECIGRPICPILVDAPCWFCEGGRIYADYEYIRLATKYRIDPEDNAAIRKDWHRKRVNVVFKIQTTEDAEVGTRHFAEVSKEGLEINFSAMGWNVEHAQSIIRRACVESGVAFHKLHSPEIVHVREYFGMFTPFSESTPYHRNKIGRKYHEFSKNLQAWQSNEVFDR